MPEPSLFSFLLKSIGQSQLKFRGIEQLRKRLRISFKAKGRSLQNRVERLMAGPQFVTPAKAHARAYAKILSETLYPQEEVGQIERITFYI